MANPKAGENGINTRFQAGKEQAKIAAKGGKASGKARQMHKTFREMDVETTTDEDIEAMLAIVRKMGRKGNLNAIKLYMEMSGMSTAPVETEAREDDGLTSALSEATKGLFSAGDDSGMIKDGDPNEKG